MTEKTTVDWLRFRTQCEVRTGLEALRGLFGERGPSLNLHHLDHGSDGFQQASQLRIGEWVIGRVDFGGESQRGWVRWNVSGIGCENVKDWDAAADLEGLPGAEIRRLDIALTTWQGEVTHEGVQAAHEAGLFACGGRPPSMQSIISSDPRAGRTHYVGKRDSDKFFRAYEKGFELLAKLGRTHRRVGEDLAARVTCIDGCPVEDIYRCEVELKAKAHEVPWEVIERRDQYFAGAYPFLAELLPDVDADILMRRPERAPQMDLLAALASCKVQYGSAIFTALAAYQGDIGRVWDQIIGDHHNETLLAAGVLEVDHG